MENILLGIGGIIMGGIILIIWYFIREPRESGEVRTWTDRVMWMGIFSLIVGIIALLEALINH